MEVVIIAVAIYFAIKPVDILLYANVVWVLFGNYYIL